MRLAHKIVVFIAYFNVLVGRAHRSLNRTHRLGIFHLRQFRGNAAGDAAKDRGGLLARRLQHRLGSLVSNKRNKTNQYHDLSNDNLIEHENRADADTHKCILVRKVRLEKLWC